MLQASESIPPQLINEALERVLASRGFRASARKQRFLEFVVQETLVGRTDRIKGYTIAVDVFGRDATFDPLLDPLVRIHAGRIRYRLEQYYLNEGATDPIRITIPKGGYVPHFALIQNNLAETHDNLAETPAPTVAVTRADVAEMAGLGLEEPMAPALPRLDAPPTGGRPPRTLKPRAIMAIAALLVLVAAFPLLLLWGDSSKRTVPLPQGPNAIVHGPSLLVLPFTNGTGNPAQDLFADGLTEDLIGALIRFRNMLVFGTDNTVRSLPASAPRDAGPAATTDYVLRGAIGQVGDHIQVTVTLMSGKDRRYLWSDSFRRDGAPGALIDLRHDIAAQVARTLAQPYGVVYREEVRGSAERPPGALSSYECLLRTRQYWRLLSPALHGQARICLERTVRIDPLYAEAWAALAMVTIDEGRLGFNRNPARPDPAATGLQLAKHAVALAPDTPLPLQALGLAYWQNGEPQLSIATYEQALSLNPNDSDILAELGRSYSLVGGWDQGIPLIREAYARNPAQPSWHRMVLALHHYMNGRYGAALEEAERVNIPESVIPHVALAIIHAEAGHAAEAAEEVRDILRVDPDFANTAKADLERRNLAPAIVGRVLDGLRKAGLPTTPRPAPAGER